MGIPGPESFTEISNLPSAGFALTQTFHYFTSPAAPFFFPGAAFALASVICAISLLPLMRGFAKAPKIEAQPPDPAGEDVEETPAAPPEGAAQTA